MAVRQGDVSRKQVNQAFLMVDSFNFNLVDEERSDIFSDLRLAMCLTQRNAWLFKDLLTYEKTKYTMVLLSYFYDNYYGNNISYY